MPESGVKDLGGEQVSHGGGAGGRGGRGGGVSQQEEEKKEERMGRRRRRKRRGRRRRRRRRRRRSQPASQPGAQICSLISGPLPILTQVKAAGDHRMLHSANQYEWTHVAISA